MGKWNGYTGNRLNPTGSFADGRVTGTLEWRCPKCAGQQESFLKDKLIECNQCAQKYFVNLLIYRAAKTFKVRCPIDWVFHKDVQTVQPLPNQTLDSRHRTECFPK
jgi:DNA-directed RNA polymerase subunit RPC12/RpoP